jgi:putative hydrolase of HD superfamily
MKDILNFFIEVGKLKNKGRRGWELHDIKNPETTAEHIFRTVVIAWTLGKIKKLNTERVIKMALIHDLCEVYAPDLTPYDPLLPKTKNKKKIMEALKHWPKFTPALKIKKHAEKHKIESEALDRLISKLPSNLKSEIKNLWMDFEKGTTKEGRFVRQVDKMENFLQGLEYWKKHGKIQHKLWIRWIKETIDDPLLIGFIKNIEVKFFHIKSARGGRR